ncbi:MAG: DNA-directed DNA polymerase [Candidatus Anstonellales archaeon]
MVRRKAYLIDVGYTTKNGGTYIKLILKGKKYCRLYFPYDPYFFSDIPITKIKPGVYNGARIKRVEESEKFFGNEKKRLTKIYAESPKDVPKLREYIYHKLGYECYEYDIVFTKRFLSDFSLTPLSLITYERDGRFIKKFISCDNENTVEFEKRMGFDIEVYNPHGAPDAKKDPVIMISYKTPDEKKVITYKKNKNESIVLAKDEKEMFSLFSEKIKKYDPEIIYGYNSSNFDIPYLESRGKVIKARVDFARWKERAKRRKKGLSTGLTIPGRVHFDLYPASRLLGQIGVINVNKFTLQDVYESVVGKEKLMVKRLDIWKLWDENREELFEYSLADAEAVFSVGEALLELEKELSVLANMTLFETTLSTSGQLVESMLIHEAQKRNMIIPRKPKEEEIKWRMANPIKGAFVKLPAPGIYENIAVFDFRGLYPSIIISYNIDPFTLTEGKENSYASPTGAHFLKKPKGLIPSTLEKLVDMRTEIKKKLKSLRKGSEEYEKLKARSQALKIISNSFYGYLGYARSRWYKRECAESVTALGREHILNAGKEAEKLGFTVLYQDTDSLFLLLGNKTKEDALRFMEHINKNLPEKMELELEDFYKRGVFVSKKAEEKGAKKKYALINEKGEIKIRGFELVRRDWSPIAKKTQLKVLKAILQEGSKEKAIEIVKETVNEIMKGHAKLKDLVIYTELKKEPRAYEVTSPEVAAALKLEKLEGRKVESGNVIGYIVSKRGRSISEKAIPVEMAKEGDYDPEYYVNNQILPAVMKILKELGVSEEDVRGLGNQKSIREFF